MSTFQPTPPEIVPAPSSEYPPNLITFMLSQWKVTTRPIKPLKHAAVHARRRLQLGALFPGELLVVPTGHSKVRANDQFYAFRPGSDFFYLTGCHEPDCVLALTPVGKSHRSVLFVEANPGKTDPTFFTDRIKGEFWEGPRPGVPEVQKLTGVDACRPLAELPEFLAAAKRQGARVLRGLSAAVEAGLGVATAPAPADLALARTLAEMRLLKDAAEIAELAAVVMATKRGFEDVICALKTARTEREVETTFWARARQEGGGVGYGTIAAAGAHACTLHWKRNDGILRAQDLLLLDAGVEGTNLYTADVTRTLPIGGRFTPAQRQIYDLVHRAQVAAIKAVKPGADFMEPNRIAMEVLAEGLADLGILKVTAEVALRPENLYYKRYTLHNVSHMLGLDVHDCAQARAEAYKFGKLQPGMVLTVEPGLYFQPDDLTVPARFRGIGIRLEDDVVVTAKGCRNLTGTVPSAADDVEDWMRSLWRPGKARR